MMNLRSGGSVRLLVVGLILLIPALAAARTLTVSPEDKNGISGALAGAGFGDVVLLGCGLYYEQGLVIPDGVTLSGYTGDPECVEIISSGVQPVFICENVGPMTRIEHLFARSDVGPSVARGAGAYLMDASPVFENCIFAGLTADYGGAVYSSGGSDPVFQHCRFIGNNARTAGAAVACVGAGAPVFEECLFVANFAETTGGSINAALGATPFLIRCTVVDSKAAVGSGLSSWDAGGLVVENSIVVNGMTGRAWDGDAPSAPAPVCTDIFGNEGGDWLGALGPYDGVGGNISADPQFCNGHDPVYPYTLNSGSPCAASANPGCGLIGAFDVNCNFLSDVEDGSGVLPAVSRLHRNYPNPFNPRTTIKFDLNRSGPVELAVFDVAGRLVKRLVNEQMPAGSHDVVWEGRDSGDRPAAAGVYFFRLKTTDVVDIKRMTLIK